MPLNPPPTIQNGLCLITQRMLRSDMARAAQVDFAFSTAVVTSPANALIIVNKFQTIFNAEFQATFDTQVSIQPPSVRMGDGTVVPTEATATGAAVNGLDANTFVPPNVAVLVKKLTPFGGKRNRGRVYFPFFVATSDVSENGTIAPAAVAFIQGTMAAFLAGMASAVIPPATPMVIANKTINHAVTPPAVTAITTGPQVTGMLTESLVATQRRRLGR